MLSYDFVVEYKRGIENRIVDALSRKDSEEVSLALIAFPSIDWLEELKVVYDQDEGVQILISQLKAKQLAHDFSMKGDLPFYKHKLYIPCQENFKIKLLELIHSSP